MPAFENFPLWGNLSILAAAAAVVWFSGTRLEAAVDKISRETGLGSAFGGMLLLAFSTSLPEVATTVSGAVMGNATLVTNNLIGGVAMQTALLVIADLAFRRGALTYFAPKFSLIMGGVALILLLSLLLVVMTIGDPVAIAGVGIGTAVLFAVHITLVHRNYVGRDDPGWEPLHMGNDDQPAPAKAATAKPGGKGGLTRQWTIFAACSAAIMVSGWAVMGSAEAVTKQTGLAASFVGATLVAIATSLPELSTTLAAVRRGDNEMAIANIFGSNLWDVSLLFVGDIFLRSGPLLANKSNQATFMAALGALTTAVYLWGLLERRNRTVGRIGVDSFAVMILYLGGLAMLYRMG